MPIVTVDFETQTPRKPMHPNHLRACESVDASVFNGEILYIDLKGFVEYLNRWNHAVQEQLNLEAPDIRVAGFGDPIEPLVCTGCNGTGLVGGLTPTGYETEDCPFCSKEKKDDV